MTRHRIAMVVLGTLIASACATGDPDLAALQRSPAVSLRMSDAVELGHFTGERQAGLDGPQRAFDARVFGVQVSDADVQAFYDRELAKLGWTRDPVATAPDTVELAAWGWCSGAMVFRVGIQDQARAFNPQFYKGQRFNAVFDARIRGRDPSLGCPERPSR